MLLSEFKEHCKSLSGDRFDRFYQEIESAYVGFIGDKTAFCNIIDNLVFDNMFIELDSFLSTCQQSTEQFPHCFGYGFTPLIYPNFSGDNAFDFVITGKYIYDNEICAYLEGEYIHDHFIDLSIPFDYEIATKLREK